MKVVVIVSVDFKCNVFSTDCSLLFHRIISLPPALISVSNARKSLNGKNKHLKLIFSRPKLSC